MYRLHLPTLAGRQPHSDIIPFKYPVPIEFMVEHYFGFFADLGNQVWAKYENILVLCIGYVKYPVLPAVKQIRERVGIVYFRAGDILVLFNAGIVTCRPAAIKGRLVVEICVICQILEKRCVDAGLHEAIINLEPSRQ